MKPRTWEWKAKVVVPIRSALLQGFRKYAEEKGFMEVEAPHITKATGACENIATMFELDYFGRKAYLTQTAQLQLEVLSQQVPTGRVYALIRSFRAEPEVDDRHLTEFDLFELEHIGNFPELLEHIEGTIESGLERVLELCPAPLREAGVEMEWLEQRWPHGIRPPFEKITYEKIVELLKSNGENIKYGDDLSSRQERMLASKLGPHFSIRWPIWLKFFNMLQCWDNPNEVWSADLVFPYSGEAVGAAEREHKYERLKARLVSSQMYKMLIERGGDISDWDWYLDFWKNWPDPKPHSGCGIGVARVMQAILKLSDIRDAVVYPMNREQIY